MTTLIKTPLGAFLAIVSIFIFNPKSGYAETCLEKYKRLDPVGFLYRPQAELFNELENHPDFRGFDISEIAQKLLKRNGTARFKNINLLYRNYCALAHANQNIGDVCTSVQHKEFILTLVHLYRTNELCTVNEDPMSLEEMVWIFFLNKNQKYVVRDAFRSELFKNGSTSELLWNGSFKDYGVSDSLIKATISQIIPKASNDRLIPFRVNKEVILVKESQIPSGSLLKDLVIASGTGETSSGTESNEVQRSSRERYSIELDSNRINSEQLRDILYRINAGQKAELFSENARSEELLNAVQYLRISPESVFSNLKEYQFGQGPLFFKRAYLLLNLDSDSHIRATRAIFSANYYVASAYRDLPMGIVDEKSAALAILAKLALSKNDFSIQSTIQQLFNPQTLALDRGVPATVLRALYEFLEEFERQPQFATNSWVKEGDFDNFELRFHFAEGFSRWKPTIMKLLPPKPSCGVVILDPVLIKVHPTANY